MPNHKIDPITIAAIPADVDSFIALRDEIATTPLGGAVIMVIALLKYGEDEALGRQLLTIALDRSQLIEGSKGYKGFQPSTRDLQFLAMQIGSRPYVPRTYFPGTAPENGYTIPAGPYTFSGHANEYSEDAGAGTFKVFIPCSGADSDRPVTLKQNNHGLWKAHTWSSLVTGTRPPAGEVADDL